MLLDNTQKTPGIKKWRQAQREKVSQCTAMAPKSGHKKIKDVDVVEIVCVWERKGYGPWGPTDKESGSALGWTPILMRFRHYPKTAQKSTVAREKKVANQMACGNARVAPAEVQTETEVEMETDAETTSDKQQLFKMKTHKMIIELAYW